MLMARIQTENNTWPTHTRKLRLTTGFSTRRNHCSTAFCFCINISVLLRQFVAIYTIVMIIIIIIILVHQADLLIPRPMT